MIRSACLIVLALTLPVLADEPPAWSPELQRELLARAQKAGTLDTSLGTVGFQDPERGEALLVRRERLEGVLRLTVELRSLGAMREERLVLQSELHLKDGTFTALRFLLVRGPVRVKGTATVTDGKLTATVSEGDTTDPSEPLARPWDASAQPLTWVLAVLAPLADGQLPAALRGRIYHGVEQALAPEAATLEWSDEAETRVLSVRGALPGERVARAGVQGGRLVWLDLGDGGRAVPLPQAELERVIAAKPVGLE